MILFILSLVLIAIGIIGIIFLNAITLQIAASLIAFLGVAMLIVYYQRIYEALRQKNNKINTQLEQLKAEFGDQLKQKNDEIKSLQHRIEEKQSFPVIPPDISLEQRIEVIRNYFAEDKKKSADYRRLFAEIIDAVKNQSMLRSINASFTTPLMERIYDTSLPLEDKDKHELTALLFQLALISIDYTKEFRSTHEGDDSLALRVAMGTMSTEEAVATATKANTNVYETEKTLRVLLALVLSLNLTDECLIVNDTLLQLDSQH